MGRGLTDEENARRAPAYRKDEALEAAMRALNARLVDVSAAAPFDGPLLLVVGPPRSGTTLLMQAMARSLDVTVPDNIVARFWGAPEVGVLVSRSLRAQLGVRHADHPTSDYGVTNDPFEPHEFGAFWTRFFDFSTGHALPDEALAVVDWAGLRGSLGAMQRAGLGRPLALKGVAVGQILAALAARVPETLCIELHRDPLDVAASMVRAREARYGDVAAWWSVRPAGHEAMAALTPLEQVARQLAGLLRGQARGLATVPEDRRLTLDYLDLCADPTAALARIAALANAHGANLDVHDPPPPQRPAGASPAASPPPWRETLRAALDAALADALKEDHVP